MKKHQRLFATLSVLALSLTIPACGGGGGGGGGGTVEGGTTGGSSAGNTTAADPLAGKTATFQFEKTGYDYINKVQHSATHVFTVEFSGNSVAHVTHACYGRTDYDESSTGTYTYVRNGDEAVLLIEGLDFERSTNSDMKLDMTYPGNSSAAYAELHIPANSTGFFSVSVSFK